MDEKPHILIVDDNNANIIALTEILNQDYTLYVAKDGINAIRLAKEHIPDLILLDILMPGMDGYEVLGHLRQDRDTQHIPIVYITGLDNAYDEKKGLRLGAADFIKKPFDFSTVKRIVNKHLR